MDRLVLRFRATEAGTRFAEAWKTARIIRDPGGTRRPRRVTSKP